MFSTSAVVGYNSLSHFLATGCTNITRHYYNHKCMNKADIINKVHDVVGGTRADAERAVETMIDCIVDSLKKGQEVSIAGLGIFSSKKRDARTGRNPRTGETIDIPSMSVPKFRASKALKDAVK